MAKVDLFAGLPGGVSVATLGAPGTGKSTLGGSAGKLGRAKLLATKPREANSWLYRETGMAADASLFHDPKWRPSLGMYEADGYVRLLNYLWELYADETYDFVVLDPFTDVVTLAANDILKSERAATPKDMRDSMAFYGALKYKLQEVTQALTALQFAPKPKHVIVTVHTQPAKDDGRDPNKLTADKAGKGVEYEGNVLPAIEGAYRRIFTSEFDIVVYSDVKNEKKIDKGKMVESTRYVIQVAPDNERHAKTVLGPVFAEKEIPNDFAALLEALRKGTNG